MALAMMGTMLISEQAAYAQPHAKKHHHVHHKHKKATPPASDDTAPKPPPAPERTPLCTSDETVIFGCDTGDALVALCQSHDIMQYRYSQPGLLDAHYPDTPQPMSQAFRGDTMEFPDGDGAYVTFVQNNQRITVLTALDAAGVSIKKDPTSEREVSNAICLKGTISSQLGKTFFQANKITPPDSLPDSPHEPYRFRVPLDFYPTSSGFIPPHF